MLRPFTMKAVKKLSPVGQTCRLESFNHIICSFSEKHLSYGYRGLRARHQLAALHYNENCHSQPRLDVKGRPMLWVAYKKYAGGRGVNSKTGKHRNFWVVNYSIHTSIPAYLKRLVQETYRGSLIDEALWELPDVAEEPPSMTSQLNCEAAEDVKSRHTSRFSEPHRLAKRLIKETKSSNSPSSSIVNSWHNKLWAKVMTTHKHYPMLFFRQNRWWGGVWWWRRLGIWSGLG